ncbi:MAG: hypothetical protein KIT83_20920 [Bryobacterales bacterium]|nr:hypothetical protein [Bryobacterales bacterium]
MLAVGSPNHINNHINYRGNFRRNIFHQDQDRSTCLVPLAGSTAEARLQTLGYCLSSHIHLIADPASDFGYTIPAAGPIRLDGPVSTPSRTGSP